MPVASQQPRAAQPLFVLWFADRWAKAVLQAALRDRLQAKCEKTERHEARNVRFMRPTIRGVGMTLSGTGESEYPRRRAPPIIQVPPSVPAKHRRVRRDPTAPGATLLPRKRMPKRLGSRPLRHRRTRRSPGIPVGRRAYFNGAQFRTIR